MRVFGSRCVAYEFIKSKLDARSTPGIFVGYDFHSSAYMIYFPNIRTVRKVRRECVKFYSEASSTPPAFSISPSVASTPQVCQEPPVTDASQPPAALPENMSGTPAALHEPASAPPAATGQPDDAKASHTAATQTPPVARPSIFGDRYPERQRNAPKRLDDYVTNVTHESFVHHCYRVSEVLVPVTYDQAVQSPEASRWKVAMDEEMSSLQENDTYELSPLPDGRKAVGGRWVYQVKPNPNGEEKYKARYVAKGFSQIENVDFTETFAPTAKVDTLRTLVNVAVQKNYVLHQMDVKTAFLNAEIDSEIFVEQPEGYVNFDQTGKPLYFKLKKSLYGLKQSSRLWNSKLHKFFISQKMSFNPKVIHVYTLNFVVMMFLLC